MPPNFINHMTPCKKEETDLEDAFKAIAYYAMSRQRNFQFAVGSAKCAHMVLESIIVSDILHLYDIYIYYD